MLFSAKKTLIIKLKLFVRFEIKVLDKFKKLFNNVKCEIFLIEKKFYNLNIDSISCKNFLKIIRKIDLFNI